MAAQKKARIEHTTQCYDWDFTFFGNDGALPPVPNFVSLIRPLFKKWTFQLEECPTSARPHYQGRGSLFKKKRHGELCTLLNDTDLKGMHVSECSLESRTKEAFYTMKLDTRKDGPWDDTKWKAPAYIPRQFRGLIDRLYPFQRSILDSRNDFNDRLVNLIVDTEGCHGKSTTAALGALHHGGLMLPPIGDHKELTQVVCDVLIGRQEREPGLVFVDLPRALTHGDQRKMAPFMVAIEVIKLGYVCDVRHHFKDWWFDSPAVWVMTNAVPNVKYMSRDRWRFWAITPTKELSSLTRDDLSHMSQDQEI